MQRKMRNSALIYSLPEDPSIKRRSQELTNRKTKDKNNLNPGKERRVRRN